MNLLRKKIIGICFLIFTGVPFLNMSFFMAEVAALKNEYTKTEIENIAKLLSASLAEEEQDINSSEKHSATTVDLLSAHLGHLQLEAIGVSTILRILGGKNAPLPGYYRIITPPPDLA